MLEIGCMSEEYMMKRKEGCGKELRLLSTALFHVMVQKVVPETIANNENNILPIRTDNWLCE